MADDNYDEAAAAGDDSTASDEICKIYDNDDFFTVFVQILLALFALASLWIKRMYEKPKRKFKTWFLDISKQGFGACYAHVLNMVIAAVLSRNIRGDTVLDDQCAWYGMSFLIDCTLGLALSIFFLRLLDYTANANDWLSLRHSGVYIGNTAMLHWAHQVVAWLLILTIVKIVMYLFMWIASEPLAWIGSILFAPLQANKRFELLFVMILFPGFLNIIYFWIADHYLKAGSEHTSAHEQEIETTEITTDKEESLLTDNDKKEGTTFASQPWSSVTQAAGAPNSAMV
mmetsp:Transcript_15268/g.25409  ORF Transcript_15268/g.25409 Transcript_15268/m.25409 type:complete len:286 (-) Transcript_15268:110-967(-)|eukprot:CAMPEP_0119010552 /NCGR_PEP_ID=MMETSP1176-20130426/5089_1 /TAXON_ID=265551 /ORGANISM="Synedropsis recta cf, Strain CCMP1620" /LENGTH=285 /DNA_ID=CAMNT_0006963229 /DNA_START=156 /DNA_END=1013 /DNA_ORIENTATION=-